jgi:hypothetical protein
VRLATCVVIVTGVAGVSAGRIALAIALARKILAGPAAATAPAAAFTALAAIARV